ncbi:MAG TPA: hypothetical protein VJB99_00865 [Patescibacteria group bacterium]|nr:hypothetical protein [Patescibacteria group bacterium]
MSVEREKEFFRDSPSSGEVERETVSPSRRERLGWAEGILNRLVLSRQYDENGRVETNPYFPKGQATLVARLPLSEFLLDVVDLFPEESPETVAEQFRRAVSSVGERVWTGSLVEEASRVDKIARELARCAAVGGFFQDASSLDQRVFLERLGVALEPVYNLFSKNTVK